MIMLYERGMVLPFNYIYSIYMMWQENLYASMNPREISVGYLTPDRVTLVDKAEGERSD
jgi:hypothetical protein